MANRKGTRRGSGKQHDQSWSVLVIDDTVFGPAPAIQADLLEGADWTAGTGFERATLLRIRGWMTLTPAEPQAQTSAFVTISKVDENDPAAQGSPLDPVTYADEDVLWTYGTSSTALAISPDIVVPTINVDIKSMRRLTSADDIRVSWVTNVAATTWSCSGVLRCLVRRG